MGLLVETFLSQCRARSYGARVGRSAAQRCGQVHMRWGFLFGFIACRASRSFLSAVGSRVLRLRVMRVDHEIHGAFLLGPCRHLSKLEIQKNFKIRFLNKI